MEEGTKARTVASTQVYHPRQRAVLTRCRGCSAVRRAALCAYDVCAVLRARMMLVVCSTERAYGGSLQY
eukprot:3941501-Rhodomonas_salina.3